MPFGKYRGQPIDAIPPSYLRWVLREVRNLAPALRREIEQVLAEVDGYRPGPSQPPPSPPPPPVPWDGILRNWYRGLALDYHPDRGGSVEAMQAINEAHDRLRKMVGR
jgi:hypothetical protein